MPHEPADKFKRVALLKSGPWTPVPKFFFRLRRYFPELPNSWWTALEYILDVTLGSPSGVEGTLAYSEVPVQSFQFKNYVAALDGYGRLLTVAKAGYADTAGSTFRLNPDATEEDWLYFHDLLRAAHAEGGLERGWKVEEVKKYFSELRRSPAHPPLWSTALLRCMAPKEDEGNYADYVASDWYKTFGTIDLWDSKNWVKRGFDTMQLHDWFDRGNDPQSAEIYWYLTKLFHEAWVSTDEENDRPLLPDDLEQLNHAVSFENEQENATRDLRPTIEKYFKKVEVNGEMWLDSEWLTKQWRLARGLHIKIDDPAMKAFGEAVDKVERDRRDKILSRRPRHEK